MIDIKLDEHTTEDVKAIQELRRFGFSDEAIQKMYDDQKRRDSAEKEERR